MGLGCRLYSKTQNLSVTNIKKPNYIKLYPNPAHTSFKINKPINSLSIYDLTGKQIKSFNEDKPFDVSDLCQGIYIVKTKILIIKKKALLN